MDQSTDSPINGPSHPGPRALHEAGRREKLGRQLLALLELGAALLVAFILTFVLTIPFFFGEVDTRLEFPLEPAAGPIEPVPVEKLRDELESLGVAGEVRISRSKQGTRLVLADMASVAEATVAASNLLEDAGYLRTGFERQHGMDLGSVLEHSGTAIFTIQALAFIVVGTLLARLRIGRQLVGRVPAGVASTVLWGIGGGVAVFGGSIGLAFVLQRIGLPVAEQEWVVELFSNREAVWSFAPWIVLIVPFSEEIFFRWYALRFLTQRIGPVAGLVLSSSLFALIHLNLSGFFIYFLIGLVLGLIYQRTQRLAAPVLGHVIHNALVLSVSMMAPTP